MTSRRLPGSTGFPLVGETLHFLRDMQQFLDTRIAQYGTLFRTNILRASTVFSCAYASTLNILLPPASSQSRPSLEAAAAYSEFMAALYPAPNILLSQDESRIRTAGTLTLDRLLSTSLPHYLPTIRSIITSHIHSFIPSAPQKHVPIRPYRFFKSLTERVVTTVVLGELSGTEYANIRRLCSEHFNGVVSAPIHLDAFGARTARAAAVRAYEQLIQMIVFRLNAEIAKGGSDRSAVGLLAKELVSTGTADKQRIAESSQLILIVLSTAIPKALASALSSVALQLRNPASSHLQETIRSESKISKSETLDAVLIETLRLYPPLPGGMRMSNGATIEEKDVPEGSRVWYSALHSNRDDSVYREAKRFVPGRWHADLKQRTSGSLGCPFAKPGAGEKSRVPTPLSFGAGVRHCKGRDLAWAIMRECLSCLLTAFEIEETVGVWDDNLRFVPVLRAARDDEIMLRPREVERAGCAIFTNSA